MVSHLLAALLVLGSSPNPPMWTDGTPLVPGIMEMTGRHDPTVLPSGPLASGDKGHEVGDTINFWAIDYSGEYPKFYITPATCRYVGGRTYIFVEDSQWEVNYDQEALAAFAQSLEHSTPACSLGIVERDTQVFGGIPDEIDGDPKVYFLVLDIRDGFDPLEGGSYIAGFFSPYNQFTETEAYLYYGGHSNEVEMLYIDCFPADQYDAAYTASHELVHLIQWGLKPFNSEELWVIENQAQAGTFVCGYPAFQVTTFLEVGGVTPIKWTDLNDMVEYVAGYGAGYLFFAYLFEHYGGEDYLYRSLRTSEGGIQGISQAILEATGEYPDMDRILADWMLACWIDDPGFGNGRYGWKSFRIADYDTIAPGNRPGLDYDFLVERDPFLSSGHRLSSYQGGYYTVSPQVGGSFRADAYGLGTLTSYVYDPAAGTLSEVGTGMSGDVSIPLPLDGDILLLCSSFSGLNLDVAAGSVAGTGDVFALYPQPCHGTLYLQFMSDGSDVVFEIFSVDSRHVDTVEFESPGTGEVTLALPVVADMASGTYLYRFKQGSRVETGSFAVVR